MEADVISSAATSAAGAPKDGFYKMQEQLPRKQVAFGFSVHGMLNMVLQVSRQNLPRASTQLEPAGQSASSLQLLQMAPLPNSH